MSVLSGLPTLAHPCVEVHCWVHPCFSSSAPRLVCLNLDSFGDGRLVLIQLLFCEGVPCKICSKQYMAFLWSFLLAFSPSVLLVSMKCIHTIVLTQPSLGRNVLLDRSDIYMIDNLLLAVHTFVECILTSLSIDEILLQRYVNLSTNFNHQSL